MTGFLEEIRQLSEDGDTSAALELVNLWLSEYPFDQEAQFLKADLCLRRKQNYAYVSQFLLDYAHEQGEPFALLRQRCADIAWSLVAEGRERLRGRHQGEALEIFNNAVMLLPADPVVSLAAGLALTRMIPMPEESGLPSPFDAARKKLNPTTLSAEIEAHLQRVITTTLVDQRPYEVAAVALIRHGLAQGKLNSRALTLLEPIPMPMPSTLDLQAELHSRVLALTFDTIANLLRMGLTDKADLLFTVCERMNSCPCTFTDLSRRAA